MDRYSFSYRDHKVMDRFVRGCNINATSFQEAIELFEEEKENCEILGILKSKIE